MLVTDELRKELVEKLKTHIEKLDHPTYNMNPADPASCVEQMKTGNYTLDVPPWRAIFTRMYVDPKHHWRQCSFSCRGKGTYSTVEVDELASIVRDATPVHEFLQYGVFGRPDVIQFGWK